MLITRRLSVLSPILAAKRGQNRREFLRARGVQNEDENLNYITTPLSRWLWALREAKDALGLEDVCVETILPGRYFTVKNTSTFSRSYRKGKNGGKQMEKFEAVSTGHVIELNFTLAYSLPPEIDPLESGDRPPTEVEFDAMLEHIGQHLGMSEFGHGYEYGRFEIKKITTGELL